VGGGAALNYPAYLREGGVPSHTYGVLSYNRRSRCWVIKAEPCVTELAKRLFPGCIGRGRGEARFTAHRRIVGEINWLMLRYPLEVRATDRDRWEEALGQAREYAAWREARLAMPETAAPPKGRFSGELMAFQQEGLAFLLGSRRALLADEMGLGKTVQALAYLATTAQFPALIVVPPHLMRNWQREIDRFLRLDGGTRVHVIRGLTPYALPEADVYIVHYLLLRGWKQALPEYRFQVVIFDEIQELRRAGTEKYSSASLIAGAADSVIGLSGTPIYNHGGEIWNVVNILDFHFLGGWESFSREWCYGYNSAIVAKPELLGDHLRREGLMLRRTKAQVLSQLPPKRRLIQEIDWDDALYRDLMVPVLEKVLALEGVQNPSARALAEDDICQRHRQATGIAKAPYVAAFVRSLLEEGEVVLLFAHHHAVMDAYKAGLKAFRPAFITGRESEAQKDAAASAFMQGKTNLCCISLRSASGLNLQRATCVVFGELDWSPAVHSQAEDRAHRIGQVDSLLCYYLVSPRGSDQDMQEALGLKVSQFVKIMGEEAPSQQQKLIFETEARARIQRMIDRIRREGAAG
jgi:SWI/SNF-related matrix-associated actin-dependent regulator 1 of chromatin subfamily A